MALSSSDMKQVPWFSLSEWHDVYKKIYSNDTAEQTKAYEALLAWKARMPKLPVGVDSTLSILQVCLRDREWTSKIDSGELPMYWENDLSLMYSTTIMRFLNHITNIGHTKQTSLFRIAKQLKIPEWIVDLRHNTAHGHALAPLGVLRIAVNILLEWLHDEYWAAEIDAMEKYYTKEPDTVDEEDDLEEIQALTDLIELWTSVGLYIHAGNQLVSDIPDVQLKETLQDLRTHMLSQHSKEDLDNINDMQINTDNIKNSKKYNLVAAQVLLLTEITAYLSKNGSTLKDDTICAVLCENEVFLPNTDVMQIFLQGNERESLKSKLLPSDMLWFWKDIIILLHKKGLLEALVFKLFNIINEEQESKERRTFAALWISSIIYSFVQLDIAQNVCRNISLKYKLNDTSLSTKDLIQNVKKHVHAGHPYLQNVLWLDISSTIPRFLLDKNFLSKLLLRINEFSAGLILPILKLVRPEIDAQREKHLSNLFKIYILQQECSYENNGIHKDNREKIFTIEDLHAKYPIENKIQLHKKEHEAEKTSNLLTDQIIRNLHWKSAPDTHQWIGCPIGLLPWQDSMKSLEPLKVNPSKHSVSTLDSQIVVAGIINSKNLKMKSCINWDNVLRKKRRIKRKRDKGDAVVIMNRALEIAKKQK